MDQVQLRVLTDEEVRRIIEEAFALLADTGVAVAGEGVRSAFARAGAKVEANGRVRLPKELTKELLAMAPPSHHCETIGGEHIQVGGGGQKVVSLVLDPLILDYADGLRPPRLSDVTSHTRLGDALPLVNTTYKMDQGLEGMTLLESNVRSVCEFLSNTTRHVAASPADRSSLRIWIEMIEVALDGATLAERPIASLGAHMKTPLRLPEHECEVIAEATARAIPFCIGSCPMAGATSPFTLAGTLMLTVAETAFMACAVQACRPSHPLLARSSMFPFNMKSGNVSAGGIETSLLEAGNAQLMRQMKLPVGGTCTFNEPRQIDFQSGLETAFKCLSYVLSDADVVSGLGSVGNALGVSAEKMLLDHDCLEMARRFRQGIRVDDDTLAATAIREVVAATGDFMSNEHTLAHLRTDEHYYGGLFVREGRSGQTMLARAHERQQEILRTHEPNVPGARRDALARRAEQLEKELGD